MLGAVRQLQEQAAYYAHTADARCTLSATAVMFVVVVGIGLSMHIHTRSCCYDECDRLFLLHTDHLWIVCIHKESVVRAWCPAAFVRNYVQ